MWTKTSFRQLNFLRSDTTDREIRESWGFVLAKVEYKRLSDTSWLEQYWKIQKWPSIIIMIYNIIRETHAAIVDFWLLDPAVLGRTLRWKCEWKSVCKAFHCKFFSSILVNIYCCLTVTYTCMPYWRRQAQELLTYLFVKRRVLIKDYFTQLWSWYAFSFLHFYSQCYIWLIAVDFATAISRCVWIMKMSQPLVDDTMVVYYNGYCYDNPSHPRKINIICLSSSS